MVGTTMAIRFIEIHPADSAEELNTEWVIITNDGKVPFHTRNVGMTVGRRGSAKKYLLGIIEPGFVLQPGDKVRMCTGNPTTEEHGKPPAETAFVRNYFLLRSKTYVKEPGAVLTLTLRGLPISKGEFDPTNPGSVR